MKVTTRRFLTVCLVTWSIWASINVLFHIVHYLIQ